jgi:hypothetical protein
VDNPALRDPVGDESGPSDETNPPAESAPGDDTVLPGETVPDAPDPDETGNETVPDDPDPNETGDDTGPENDDPLDIDISLASSENPSIPNTNPARLAKFLNPDPIEPITDETYKAISNETDLRKIGVENDYPLNGKYYLTQDIALTEDWTPIGDNSTNNAASRFTGTFDGQGYEISGLNISGDVRYAGLFGYVFGATIKNLGLVETNINISITENPTPNAFYVYAGSIFGCTDSVGSSTPSLVTISNCYNEGTVSVAVHLENIPSSMATVTPCVGGLGGYFYPSSNSVLEYSANAGTVSATLDMGPHDTRVGGICGEAGGSNVKLVNCVNEADVSAQGDGSFSIGGVFGRLSRSSGTMTNNLQNKGAVSGLSTESGRNAYVGGVFGVIRGSTDPHTIKNCKNTGTVSSSDCAGGICGYDMYSRTTYEDCENAGTVTASNYAGGIIGFGQAGGGNILRCTNSGAVSATADYAQAGGICAEAWSGGSTSEFLFRDCTNTGKVTGVSRAGGIAAFASANGSGALVTFSACTNNGDVTATSPSGDADGICGDEYARNGGVITIEANCVNTGKVTIGTGTPTATIAITATGATIISGRISVLVGAAPIQLAAVDGSNASTPVAASWKSSKASVAAVDSTGKVTIVGAGEATITATGTTGDFKDKTATVVIAVGDETPTLPVSTIALNSAADLGTLFTVLAGGKAFDGVQIASVTGPTNTAAAFALSKEANSTSQYRLKAAAPASATALPNGKYTLKLQATNVGANVGGQLTLTVNVTRALPKPAVKMPSLNTFWQFAAGAIAISGTNLPTIEKIELKDSPSAADGKVTENFGVASVSGNSLGGAWAVAAKERKADGGFNSLDGKGKPAVKGVLEITFAGFAEPTKVNVTVSQKATAPKLALGPATQTIAIKQGADTTATVVVTAADRSKLAKVVRQGASGGNAFIAETITTSGNSFTVTMNSTVAANATYKLRLEAWLEGAAQPIVIQPTVKTAREGAAATYKLSAATLTLNSTVANTAQTVSIVPSIANAEVPAIEGIEPAAQAGVTVAKDGDTALLVTVPKGTAAGSYRFAVAHNGKTLTLTVKVDARDLTATVKVVGKGNIDLLNREGTARVFAPTIKNTNLGIKEVKLVGGAKPANSGDNQFFNCAYDGESGQITVTAKTDTTPKLRRGASYKVRLEFTLDDGTENGFKVTTKDITIKPAQGTPKHSLPTNTTLYLSWPGDGNTHTINFAPTAPAGARVADLKFKNPADNDAYTISFDQGTQTLSLYLKDPTKANRGRAGKATLTFSATYEGQGIEANGQPKARDVKLTVVIAR